MHRMHWHFIVRKAQSHTVVIDEDGKRNANAIEELTPVQKSPGDAKKWPIQATITNYNSSHTQPPYKVANQGKTTERSRDTW